MSRIHTIEMPERISKDIVRGILTQLILSGGNLRTILLDNVLTTSNSDSKEESEAIAYLVATLFVVWECYREKLATDDVYVSGFEIKDYNRGYILGLKLDG